MDASVIIPTFNKASRLCRVLEAFRYQTVRSFEVVVCNDGSTDETAKALEAFAGGGLPYSLKVTNTANQGAGAARNRAVSVSRGDILIFNDDDMIPSPRYVEAHIAAASNGRFVSRGERWTVPIEVAETFASEPAAPEGLEKLWTASRLSVGENWTRTALTVSPGHYFKWLQSCTSNLAISREGFDRAGGFDEHYGTRWGAEDTDFGYCADRAGWMMTYNPEALNCHLEHSTSSSAKFEQAYPNFLYMQSKYQNRVIDTLLDFISVKIAGQASHDLFNEDEFTNDLPPKVAYR
ncbi:glycosyltransferase [Cohnella lubricantis]|uniref:Glycosyltransferase n=1 Tax=Cohnella lubricantis TaxID=2163172 RepID=A0A841TDZ9_9BACL|nr:glycosyltransferase [Cohnella lubricantis]MBB6677460.1 glycosyltransferase [Cohnella lubricantis]MBP2116654.1 glycosyltransferase involved in cell wall biosynthesis [Cohnella lubricantis]